MCSEETVWALAAVSVCPLPEFSASLCSYRDSILPSTSQGHLDTAYLVFWGSVSVGP